MNDRAKAHAEPSGNSNVLWRTQRQLAALMGAISLASLGKDLVNWKGLLLQLVTAWHDIVRPISTFLFGWIFQLLHLTFPTFLKDWMMVGLIMLSGLVRAMISPEGRRISAELSEMTRASVPTVIVGLALFISAPLTWPLFIYFSSRSDDSNSRFGQLLNAQRKNIQRYWLATLTWFFVLLAINWIAYQEITREYLGQIVNELSH